jgi:hypothetical protein
VDLLAPWYTLLVRRHFDSSAFFACLESHKAILGLSWGQVAQELEIDDLSVFNRLNHGDEVDVDTIVTLSAWLGLPLSDFTRGDVIVAADTRAITIAAIDDALAEGRDPAKTSVLRAARAQLAESA